MLKREIKRWDLVLLIINITIGAGIFGLPSKIFSLAGVYSIAAIFICALLMMVIILNLSEVASQFKKTGGPYLYTLKAFGKFPGYIIGWLALISRIAAYAALINLLVDYLSYLNERFNDQSVRSITIIIITAIIFLVNYRGVKNSSRLNNILGISKLIPLTIFVIVGFFYIDFNLLDFNQSYPSITDFSSAILILVFAFTGFEAAVINTGEMSNPEKDIPFALIFSTLFVALFYILIQVVSVGIYPDLANSNKPIADAADFIFGSTGGLLITIGAVISIGGTLNANLLAGSRLPFALSEENQFPRVFSKTNTKTAIPYVSLIVYSVVTILVSVTGTFIYALSISVISKVFVFAIISAALIKLRTVNKQNKTGFKLRFGSLSAILGIILCIWLLSASKLSDFKDVIIIIIAGLIIYFIFKFTMKMRNK
jgi:APA family basic amino acid/polyamine antiporter